MKLGLASLAMSAVFVSAPFPSARAAIPSNVKPIPAKILVEKGAVTGGIAGTGFSLTNVTFAKVAGKERVILDIGDKSGAPIKGYPGYFHAELQEKPNRLVIDFAQTPAAMIDEKFIDKQLKASGLIAKSTLLLDPTDQTLSLILDLKKRAKAQVFQVPGQKGTGRVVVDLL